MIEAAHTHTHAHAHTSTGIFYWLISKLSDPCRLITQFIIKFVICLILSLGAFKVIPKVNTFQFQEGTSILEIEERITTNTTVFCSVLKIY